MHYLIYKITCTLNNKIYIGAHRSKKIPDKYMGSGKYIKRAIEKHGKENFIKEIMFTFDNSHDMYVKEREIVNEEYLKSEGHYNLKLGGRGGFDHILEKKKSDPDFKKSIHKKIGKSNQGQVRSEEFRLKVSQQRRGTKASEETREKQRKSQQRRRSDPNVIDKRIWSEEAKIRSGIRRRGSIWITNPNLKQNKFIKSNLEDYLSNGWVKGRARYK